MTTAPSCVSGGTFNGPRLIPPAHERSFSQDTVLCRRLKGLVDRIKEEGPKDGLKCQVQKWTEAWEVEEYFNSLRSQIHPPRM